MNARELVKERLPVAEAFAAGKSIQWKTSELVPWIELRASDECVPSFFDSAYMWRIKPEPRKFTIRNCPATGGHHYINDGHISMATACSACSIIHVTEDAQ